MQEKTKKLITWISLGVAILGSIFAIIFALDQEKFSNMFDIAYWFMFAFVIATIAAMLIFLVTRVIKGRGKGLIIGLGLLVAVAVVAFLLSKGTDISSAVLEKNNVTEGTSKMVGAGCITIYILLIASALSILYVEVSTVFKKK